MAVQSSEKVARFLLDALAPKLTDTPGNARPDMEIANHSHWESAFVADLDGFGAYERFVVIVRAID